MIVEKTLRQLLYVSTAKVAVGKRDIDRIFESSRHNNAIDGVTGLLYTDGTRFLQVLEGPAASIAETFARIRVDPLHRDIIVLQDEFIADHQFGYWSMAAHDPRTAADSFNDRMVRMLENASREVREAFLDLIPGQRVGGNS